ncbi:hypothetical protein K443DRAFT_142017 [Laccaria amethystina LaAM-08-1]|uniref:PRMT5 oligomerisation domain-containing protein n=1 Tax=Laccaria amethystina LaAM-08-1 TaxID=1095629 RepID=A0A0C9YIN5_9AGAR|nr:hypothetical protein K443DRAFT_142017 [Laccaria amethystina LaAM-08-1]
MFPMRGFFMAGYFEAVLYGNIELSIHPHRKGQISKDMLSWFPLLFPLKEPLYLPSNSELQISIWRSTNERQVWYECFSATTLLRSVRRVRWRMGWRRHLLTPAPSRKMQGATTRESR